MRGQNFVRGNRVGVFEFVGVLAGQVCDHADGENFRAVDGDRKHDRTFASFTVRMNQQIAAQLRFLFPGLDNLGLFSIVLLTANRTFENVS